MSDSEGDNGWNEELEQNYIAIGDRAGARVYLYNETADFYSKINSGFSLFLVMASYVIGVAGISIAFSVDCEDATYVNLIIQLATIAVGTVEAAHRFLGLENKIAQLRWSSGKASSIFLEIQRTLSREPAHRSRPDDFCDMIASAESELRTYAPNIPGWVFFKYKKKLKDRALSYDAVYGDAVLLRQAYPKRDLRPKRDKPTNAEIFAMERYFISNS